MGNEAPVLWPRLTIEINYYGSCLATKEHDFQTWAPWSCRRSGWTTKHCCDESLTNRQWRLWRTQRKKQIKFFIKTESQIINLVSGQPGHSFKYCFHSQVRKYGRVLDEKLGNVGSGPGAITYWLCDLGQITLPPPVICFLIYKMGIKTLTLPTSLCDWGSNEIVQNALWTMK